MPQRSSSPPRGVALTARDRLSGSRQAPVPAVAALSPSAVPLALAPSRFTVSWRTLETRPGTYNFEPLARTCEASYSAHCGLILDLLNFDWPHKLDPTRHEFVDSFADFAEAAADFLSRQKLPDLTIIPVQQISLLASAAGDLALMPPFLRAMGGLVQRQLVKAAIRASHLVRRRLPSASILSLEAFVDHAASAETRISTFDTWDMLTGRLCPELGGDLRSVDVLGLRIFDRYPWLHSQPKRRRLPTRETLDRPILPTPHLLSRIQQRYSLPVVTTRVSWDIADLHPEDFELFREEQPSAPPRAFAAH